MQCSNHRPVAATRLHEIARRGWHMFTVLPKALLALPLFSLSLLIAADSDKPKLVGTWELDAAKSQLEHGPGTLQLVLQDVSGKIQFTRTIHTSEGKDLVAKFECAAGGPDCAFD